MQWDDGNNAGFTQGSPWFRLNPNYTEINAKQALADPDSVFYYYQKLIRLRKEESVLTDGKTVPIMEADEKVFAYIRESEEADLLVLGNFTEETAAYQAPDAFRGQETLISNYADEGEFGLLRPFEAKMVIVWKR